MSKQPSYEDLQKRVASLEEELSTLKAKQSTIHNINQSLFFEISEYSQNGIALFETKDKGTSFTIKYFNKKAAKLENVNRENVVGKRLIETFPGTKKSGFLDALKRVLVSNNAEEFPAIINSSGKYIEWKHNYIYKLSDQELVSIIVDETEKKNKESELKEHREKLEIAMEAANYFSFEFFFSSFKITTHKEIYTSLGYDPSEIEGLLQNFGSLINQDDYESLKLLAEHNSENKVSRTYTEFRLKNKLGKWIWHMATGKVVEWDKNRRPVKLVGLLKDIQQEKELIIKLKNSEEKFKSLVTLLPEVVYEADLNGRITYVNLKGIELFGYTSNEVKKGINLYQVIAPEDIDKVKENFKLIFSNKRTPGEEYTALTKNGKRFPVMVYSNAIVENGKTVGIRGIIINITDLKEAQQQLKTSEENFSQLSENINDAFWLRTLNNKVIYANKASYRITEGRFIEIFENFEKYLEWIHPEDKEQIIKQKEIDRQRPKANHFYEHRVIKPNGEIRWFWIRTFPVYDESGKLYRRAGIASDVTEQKSLVSELLQAKFKAEESDKLKSAFLANMSHEIRTPMNGILGFAELIKDEDITRNERIEYIDIIDQNGKQLLNLINDIIDVAKIEAGQLTVNKSKTNIKTILEETYSLFVEEQKRLNKVHLDFTVNFPRNEETSIFTDSVRLKQILNNLLSNAFKFTDSGSIKLNCELVTRHNFNYYLFSIIDTGSGINEKMKEYIFERFGQEPTKKFKNYHGTGLGLAISKGIVKLLNGEIWLESTLENENNDQAGGSTFFFTIPAIENTSSVEPNLHEDISKNIDYKNINILIVEDDEDNQDFLRRLLVKKNATILLANSGEEALETVKSNSKIQIVLMDIRLPDMDGFETTKKIKQINSKIKVIAQTAYAMYNDKTNCIEKGCDDYVSKPLDKNILFKKINQYIYS